MGLKHFLGAQYSAALDRLLACKAMPLTRYFPYGKRWLYDIQRFSQTRHCEVIFDVGANIGQTAHELSRYFPSSLIFCFEPVSSTFLQLLENTKQNRNVICVQTALGKKNGSAEIVLHENSELNTFILDAPRESTGKRESVSIETIDKFCNDRRLASIDILKMDVQGWEKNVLDGATGLLSDQAIHFIFAEIGFRRQDTDIQPFASLNEAMDEMGYMFCGLYDQYRYGDCKQFVGFANALYVNPLYKRPLEKT